MHEEGRLTDSELVAAHLAGDRDALAAIYDRYADALYDTAAAMLSDRHEAADVVQDIFVVAAERLGQLRDHTRLRAWLFAILRNEVYRRSRRRARSRPTDFASPSSPEPAAVADPGAEGAAVERDELAAMVRAAATGLEPRDQLVLELSARHGLAGADLAAAIGVSVEQSHLIVHRMRERVERSLGALVVARAGAGRCAQLATVLRGWDGNFDVQVRKRVARHVDTCDTCGETRRRFAVLPLYGAGPALAAPPELRRVVLDRASRGKSRAAVGKRYGFDADGFPTLDLHHRRLVTVAAFAAALLVVVLGVTIAIARSDDEVHTLASPPVAAVDVTPATTPPAVVSRPTTEPTPASVAPATSATTDPPPNATVATTVPATTPTTTVPATTVPVTAVPTSTVPATTTPPTTPPTTGSTTPPATAPPPPSVPPAVEIVRAVAAVSCPFARPTVAALVTATHPIDTVTLSWSGPGRPGRAMMTDSGAGQYRGSLGILRIDGVWTYVVTAVDDTGSIGTATGTIVVSRCS